MSVYVPGYGTFDPAIPSWLELRPDGKLYNKNASDPTRPWVPPAGWVGGGDLVFTPEGGTVPPPGYVPGGSVPEPAPGPAEPDPIPPPPTPPLTSVPPDLGPKFTAFYGALGNLLDAHKAALADAEADLVKERDAIVLAKLAVDRFADLIAALAAISPK